MLPVDSDDGNSCPLKGVDSLLTDGGVVLDVAGTADVVPFVTTLGEDTLNCPGFGSGVSLEVV